MTQLFTSVTLAALLFLGATFLLRWRSNPYAMAAIGVTLAPLPALYGWFHAIRGMVGRFHSISAGEPSAMAASTARALSAANADVRSAQVQTAAIVAAALVLALFCLLRRRRPETEGPTAERGADNRSRVVSVMALVALLGSLGVYELGVDALLFPLSVVASQQGQADPNLPLTTEAAKGLFIDASSQDDVSTKVGQYMVATTLGSVLVMGVILVGFVASLVSSGRTRLPRSSGVVGLLLAIVLGAATARELARHRAIEAEIGIVAARTQALDPTAPPK